MRVLGLFVGACAVLLLPAGVAAQQIDIEAAPQQPAPQPALRRPEIITPPGAREITRPRDLDFQPYDIRVRLDPAFIEPFTGVAPTSPTTGVRFGLAGWTAPQVGIHQASGVVREDPGWLVFGVSFVWDVPIEPVPVPAPPKSPAP